MIHRATLRVRVTIVAMVVVAAALAAASAALLITLRWTMLANLDDSVEARVGDLSALYDTDRLPATLEVDRDAFAQVIDPSGAVVAASRNARANPMLDPADQQGEFSAELPSVARDPVRVLVAATDDGGWIVAGAGLGDISRVLRSAGTYLLVAAPLLTALVGGLVWIVMGRSLRAVEAIRAEVADIGGGDVHRRVPEPETQDEIGQLAATMNDMLDRLETSHEAQARFVCDASHELRTPIAVMRHQLEVALREAGDHPLRGTLTEVLDEDLRLQRLVEDLLVVARRDNTDTDDGRHTLVDLDDIVLDQTARLAAAHPDHRIDTRGISAGQVRGRSDDYLRIVRNLLDNALRHAQTTVAIHLNATDDNVVLHVDDDGKGVPPNQRERIFERFTRLDESRSRESGGSGLGLAIVADLVARYDGTVSITEAPSLKGARFTVSFPDARADSGVSPNQEPEPA